MGSQKSPILDPSWLMLNVDSQRMYKMFDEVIIRSPDDYISDSDEE